MLRSIPIGLIDDMIHSRVPGTCVTPMPTFTSLVTAQPTKPTGATVTSSPALVEPKRAML